MSILMARIFLLVVLSMLFVADVFCSEENLCKPPDRPRKSYMKYKALGANNTFVSGSKIIFKCKRGYVRYGAFRMKCKEDGNWTTSPPVCVSSRIRCRQPKNIENGELKVRSTRVLRRMTYKCHQDYLLIGTRKRICLPNGRWSKKRPKCVKKKCRQPYGLSRFKNGRFVIQDKNFSIWSSIMFFCNDGYIMSNEDTMTCTDENKWLPRKIPRCYRIRCPDPGRPTNGRRLGSNFTMGATIEFFCDYGYKMIGSKRRTCQSNGIWNGNLTICDKKNSDCRNPGIPQNGGRTGNSFHVGDRVRFYCRAGYKLSGSSERTCSRNGTWTGLETICEDANRVVLVSIEETAKDFKTSVINQLSSMTCSSSSLQPCIVTSKGRTIDATQPHGVDLIFVFDASSSIGEKDFSQALQFACAVIEKLGVDHSFGGTRIAAIVYSTKAYLIYNLEDPTVNSNAKACNVTRSIRYFGGGTATGDALRLALKKVKPLFREKSKRALIIITDGNSNFGGSPETYARQLENHDVEIFVIGIGNNGNKREWNLIKSCQKSPRFPRCKFEGQHLFILKQYADFSHLINEMIKEDYSECGIGGPTHRQGRILGGNVVKHKQEWPWQVAIFKNDRLICGGSLIKNNIVLTAAHCFRYKLKIDEKLESYRVVAGQTRIRYDANGYVNTEWLRKHEIEFNRTFIHHSFPHRVPEYYDDIALIELKKPVIWTHSIRPVCLPKKNLNLHGEWGYVTGWGKTGNVSKEQSISTAKDLQYVSLPIKCNSDDVKDTPQKKIFCASDKENKKDACKGDSGGPFVLADHKSGTGQPSWSVVGIVSYGNECGKSKSLGYYTKVSNYLEWIKKTISTM